MSANELFSPHLIRTWRLVCDLDDFTQARAKRIIAGVRKNGKCLHAFNSKENYKMPLQATCPPPKKDVFLERNILPTSLNKKSITSLEIFKTS